MTSFIREENVKLLNTMNSRINLMTILKLVIIILLFLIQLIIVLNLLGKGQKVIHKIEVDVNLDRVFYNGSSKINDSVKEIFNL